MLQGTQNKLPHLANFARGDSVGEFWVGGGAGGSTKLAASVAHTTGRKYVGAESFTASDRNGRWQSHPYAIKALGDQVFCRGVNRYIFHRYAAQPWLDKRPGPGNGDR